MLHDIFSGMASKQPKVGDHIRVSMPDSKLVKAVVKAVLDDYTGGCIIRLISGRYKPR